jgi:glutamate transport system permease protein
MAASVLFDEPGPRTRVRHRVYSVIFLLLLAVVVWWVVRRLVDSGVLNREVFEELSQENIIRAFRSWVAATLKAAALGISGALVLGVLLAAARLSDHTWARWPARAFIELFRAIPLLLLIIFLDIFLVGKIDNGIRPLAALAIGLTIYNGTVLAEVFRAGIGAVPRGQSEAAYAIGLRKTQVMSLILMPQAVRVMLPAIISQCVIVLKDSSLGFVVVYMELLRQSKLIADFVDNQLVTYSVAAAIYIVLNSTLGLMATWLERRASRTGSRRAVEATEAVVPMT